MNWVVKIFSGLSILMVLCSIGCQMGAQHVGREKQLFDEGWKFYRGELEGAQEIEFDDTKWRTVDLPHDWSIEGEPQQEEEPEPGAIDVVKGQWQFQRGDNMDWSKVDFDDSGWETVGLPANWESHSNYTQNNAYGWFRRKITVPAELEGKDITLLLGMIDDVDETYFNGKLIGSTGSFPNNYQTAWNVPREYKVPKELVKYGAENVVAVRVFDGDGAGGIYTSGAGAIEGPFNATVSGGSGHGYLSGGMGWYRKSFTLPTEYEGKHIFIEFEGVYMDSDVWINGHLLGNHPYGYTSFEYELTPYLHYGEQPNLLSVRVNVQQPCSRWYSGAGIYRHVWLTATEPVHVAHWGTYVTTPEVEEERVKVRMRTRVRNQGAENKNVELETLILDKKGKIVAQKIDMDKVVSQDEREFDQFLTITKYHLWSPQSPYLYRVITKVRVDGELVDKYITPLGIRTFRFDKEKGFFLNGERFEIKGVCLHHDLGCLGAAAYDRAIERQLEIMKGMGCNAIRTSHNPPAPKQMELCDRMGFIVMDEAFDEWKQSKTRYGYGRFFDEWSERDLVSMIHRDRNHPSVVTWSIGNEIPEQGSNDAYEMSKRLVDICHREDPTRPVLSNCNNPGAAMRSGFTKPLDVVGISYNIRAYNQNRGQVKLVASETSSNLSTRGEYNLVLRDDELVIIPDYMNQCSSYDLSAPRWGYRAETSFKAIKESPWMSGEFVWTGFDYIGEPTPYGWPSRSSYFGIVDLCGFLKDRYYLYQSQWLDEPIVHILPHWNWPEYEGREIPVWCYSNAESVELFLNGKSLGEKKFSDTEDLHLEWKVPYEPGTLQAVAKKNGMVVARDEMHTVERPARITLEADRKQISLGGRDLSFITVKILDAQGRLCPNADHLIKFEIDGEGEIIGLGNGDPTNHEHFQAAQHKAFHGLCLAVVKSARKSGRIKLTAAAEDLQSDSITIRVK